MMGLFLALCLGGGAIGALGGWLSRHYQNDQEEIFDKIEPQMAMNAAITAVPASIVATALAAYIFSRLSNLLADQTGLAILDGSVVTLPLAVSLLLVLASHLVLTLVIPHEAQQAEHRCGLEEVKMAAYVGIGAAPLLALFISLAYPEALINPLVLVALLVSSSMSLKSLQNLKTVVLPRRASFPAPQEEKKQKDPSKIIWNDCNLAWVAPGGALHRLRTGDGSAASCFGVFGLNEPEPCAGKCAPFRSPLLKSHGGFSGLRRWSAWE